MVICCSSCLRRRRIRPAAVSGRAGRVAPCNCQPAAPSLALTPSRFLAVRVGWSWLPTSSASGATSARVNPISRSSIHATTRSGARIGCPSTRIVGRIASYRLYNVSDRPGFQKMQVVVQKKQDQIALSFVTSQTGDQWAVDAAKARHPST